MKSQRSQRQWLDLAKHALNRLPWPIASSILAVLILLAGVAFYGGIALIILSGRYWTSQAGAWVLDSFLIAFAVLAFRIEPPLAYKRPYDRDFRHSLEMITETEIHDGIIAFIRRYYDPREFIEENAPAIWPPSLRISRQRLDRTISDACMTACTIALVFLIWAALGYSFYSDDLSHVISEAIRLISLAPFSERLKFFAPFSLVSMLVWLHRRARADGAAHGYLYGYIDAVKKAQTAAARGIMEED